MKTYRQYLIENNDETKLIADQEIFVPTKQAIREDYQTSENSIRVPKGAEYWIDNAGLLSRDDGPAVFYQKGRRYLEVWCRHGEFHRGGDLPAFAQGTRKKQWWVNGLRHRDDGPAIYHENAGHFFEKHYYKYGFRYVPGKGEELKLINGKYGIQRKDGTIIYREQNDFNPGGINRDLREIVRPDGSIEYYADNGSLDEIDSHNDSNYNFVKEITNWSQSVNFYWKKKPVGFFPLSYGEIKTNFKKETFFKFLIQLGLESYLEYFGGTGLDDDTKWKLLKQSPDKFVTQIKDFNKDQQEYLIEKRPDLIHKIINLDPELAKKYKNELNMSGIDI